MKFPFSKALFVVTICLLLNSCQKSTYDHLIGKWSAVDAYGVSGDYKFDPGGACMMIVRTAAIQSRCKVGSEASNGNFTLTFEHTNENGHDLVALAKFIDDDTLMFRYSDEIDQIPTDFSQSTEEKNQFILKRQK